MSSPAPLSLPTPADLASTAESVAIGKVTSSPLKTIMLALTGGGYIALGFIFFTTSQVGASAMPYGVARVLGGTVFVTGLALVVLTGAELFTSSTLSLTAKASGRISWLQLAKNWVLVYLGNFVGALTMVALIWLGGTWQSANGGWGKVVLDTSLHKVHHTFVEAVALGVLCNLLVCLAIWVGYSARTTTDKMLAVWPPIALFVATGFEHSVANMFMVPLGLLIKDFAPAEFWTAIGTDSGAYADLTWASFLGSNLAPVTLGNIIGGGLMIGFFYWTVYLREHDKK